MRGSTYLLIAPYVEGKGTASDTMLALIGSGSWAVVAGRPGPAWAWGPPVPATVAAGCRGLAPAVAAWEEVAAAAPAAPRCLKARGGLGSPAWHPAP